MHLKETSKWSVLSHDDIIMLKGSENEKCRKVHSRRNHVEDPEKCICCDLRQRVGCVLRRRGENIKTKLIGCRFENVENVTTLSWRSAAPCLSRKCGVGLCHSHITWVSHSVINVNRHRYAGCIGRKCSVKPVSQSSALFLPFYKKKKKTKGRKEKKSFLGIVSKK